MASLYHIVVSLSVLLLLVTYSSAFDPETEFCSSSMSSESPIRSNIDHFLDNLTPKFEQGARFVESSYGNGENKIYGLAQCRGLADPKTCLGCIHDSAQEIQNLCPNQPNVGIWFDFCFIRYSPDQFYDKIDTTNAALFGNTENVTDTDALAKLLGKLFDTLITNAVKPGNGGFAKGTKDLSEFDTVYGMAECTGDLSSDSCAQCLGAAVENFKGFCSGRKGCRVFYVNCNVRYEIYPFFNSQKLTNGEKLEKVIIHKS